MKNIQKSNRLTGIRNLLDGMKGHNYALPDCLKFIFERLGAHETLDFWNLAAVTGDVAAQVYNRNPTTSCEYCVSGYLSGPEYMAYVFDTLGYSHEYARAGEVAADLSGYMEKIAEYIDKGVPVLVRTNLNDIPAWKSDVGTHCLAVGYDNFGQTLKLLVRDTFTIDYELDGGNKLDLIFIGEKLREVSPEEIYLAIINKIPSWLTLAERGGMCFGAAAYRAWADDIDAGRFAGENLPLWENYGVYVCNLATSGGEPTYIYRKLADMNPAYSALADLGAEIQALLPAETPTGGRSLLWIELEKLGGGMDMGEVKATMRDEAKRSKVAAALRDYADRLDKAVALMREGAILVR